MVFFLGLISAQAEVAPLPPPRLESEPSQGSLLSQLKQNWDLNYFMRLNGPSLGGPLYQGYSPFSASSWPLQAYQSVMAAVRPNLSWALGVNVSFATNLNSNVTGSTGSAVAAGTTIFHPDLFVKRYSIIENDWSYWNFQVGVRLPTSSFASQSTQIAAFPINLTGAMKLRAPWQLELNLTLRPTFYQQVYPSEPWMLKRETFYGSLGHSVSYALSDSWELVNTSLIDVQHLADPAASLGLLTSATDPRMEWKLNRYFFSRSLRLGVSLLHRLPLPTLSTSTINAEMSWDLL